MSQTKAQLVAPIGVVTSGGIVASGVVTASTLDGSVTGSATSIIQGKNLNVGIISATDFAGDFSGTATGIITSSAIKVGSFTATSFVGDFTGTATSMFKGTGFTAGTVNATSFEANVTGNVTGNATGIAGSLTQGTNIHVGIATGSGYSGDGSNLTGVAATNFNAQTVTVSAATTTIDLSAGNIIKLDQSASTTVSLANTSEAMDVTLIRSPSTISFPTYGVEFNGSNEVLEIPDSTDFDFGTGDFTVELWVYLSSNSSNNPVLIGADGGWYIQLKTGDTIVEFYTGSTSHSDTSTALSTGTWHHIAAARSGTTFKMFVDGTERISATESGSVNIGDAINIGRYGAGTLYFTGSISNVRVTKGQALYTADFTVPISALTTTSQGATASNVKLLCCNDQYIRGATKSPNISGINDGTVWSAGDFKRVSDNSDVPWDSTSPISEFFNGRSTGGDSAYPASAGDWYWTIPDVPCTTSCKIVYNAGTGIPSYGTQLTLVTDAGSVSVSGSSGTLAETTFTLPAGTTKLTKITCPAGTGSNWFDPVYFEVDGTMLVDPVTTPSGNPPAFNTTVDSDSVFLSTQSDLSITWPSSIKWNGGSAPTLLADAGSLNQLSLLTRDTGVTWYGWESFSDRVRGAELWMWGENTYGQLQQNNITDRSSPVQVPGTTWDKILNVASLYGVKNDGTLWAGGYNGEGQLGQNTVTKYSSPVQVPGTTWKDVNGLNNPQVITLKTDNTIWTWGNNQYGGLGQNSPTNTHLSSPTQMGNGRDWKIIAGGVSCMGSLKTDGTLWTWGRNQRGELGQNTTDDHSSSPKQVGGDTTWSYLTGQREAFIAVKTDGTLWAWGNNSSGQMGQNNTTGYSSPMQIGTDTNWDGTRMDGKGESTFVFKTDGTLWNWGANNYGELGHNVSYDGSSKHLSSPTQLPGSWANAYSTGDHSIATRTDGTLWGFGNNEKGNLAGNVGSTPGARSSPTQIGTSSNWSVEGVRCASKQGSALRS